ncbi:MAG: mannose-1-phosphate guanylyltransferase [Leptospiraceae bacterium]|nr:mannose-1-phosphate guanylyltransferase [Leptospiraceae bacterium]
MAGGKGERFWPRSRNSWPKQLQKVYSNQTLLDETIDRALRLTKLEHIYIGCNAELKKAILKSHQRIRPQQFIVEPQGRNTAPIIALAALHFEKKYTDCIQVILSADHYIAPLQEFQQSLARAIKLASGGRLVTLGVRPSRPETGYGYIQKGRALSGFDFAYHIKSFREKPDLKTAMGYLRKAEHYFWNSGIFIWRTSDILKEFEKHADEIIAPLQAAFQSPSRLKKVFPEIPALPVDIAIMEKSKNLAMVPAGFVWDDVGAWTALQRVLPCDPDNNVILGTGKPNQLQVLESSSNTVVSARPLVALLGVNDLVVVEEDDVLFISQKLSLDKIKKFMAQMKTNPALQKYFR